MKKFMVAYISPEYGLQMTQTEAEVDWVYEFGFKELKQVLLAEGETKHDIQEIYEENNWIVKEIK